MNLTGLEGPQVVAEAAAQEAYEQEYKRLDARIDQAEDDGIKARWEFGRALLSERQGKKLPKGRLEAVASAVGKSAQEINYRMKLASRCPDTTSLSNAVGEWGSWHQIVNKFLASTAHLSSNKDEWATPSDLFAAINAEFQFTLDVCAEPWNAKCESFFSEDDDALSDACSWTGVCWMNPPYSKIGEWMKKAYEASQNGATVVCLVPCRTDVAWFWEYARHGEIRLIRGRLHFVDEKGNTGPAPFPSCLVIFGHKPKITWYGGYEHDDT